MGPSFYSNLSLFNPAMDWYCSDSFRPKRLQAQQAHDIQVAQQRFVRVCVCMYVFILLAICFSGLCVFGQFLKANGAPDTQTTFLRQQRAAAFDVPIHPSKRGDFCRGPQSQIHEENAQGVHSDQEMGRASGTRPAVRGAEHNRGGRGQVDGCFKGGADHCRCPARHLRGSQRFVQVLNAWAWCSNRSCPCLPDNLGGAANHASAGERPICRLWLCSGACAGKGVLWFRFNLVLDRFGKFGAHTDLLPDYGPHFGPMREKLTHRRL